ncbi:hypothetical protein shim_24600 [Shimia sp. SK013]|uniref:hypothetical protein n=1 Tax=Shimia sp. SK013 TaxID=1389006 RepID=UPI0006B50FC5|nr:hypothetical protein [Shimia sp. SK013]KPA21753.1 hypothetical protein shim_24600 [Shimia sp. SK013]
MTRIFLTGCALVALAACQPAIPDSAAGVGFDNVHNSPEARAKRDSQLTGTALPSPHAVSQETVPPPPPVSAAPLSATQPAAAVPAAPATQTAPLPTTAPATSEAADIAAETQAALRTSANNSGQEPLHASPSNPAPEVFSNPGISDENNFGAVEDRRSLEADAARRERNKAQYTVVETGAVPTRSGATGPNIVAYALSTSHPVGTKAHNRLSLKTAAQHQAACNKFASPDLAQIAFLEKGGPKRDRLGLDPDGDGFACDWDPTPFRSVSGN